MFDNESLNKQFAEEKHVKKVENFLKKIGVNVRDLQGNYRNTYDVLKDISVKFDKFL